MNIKINALIFSDLDKSTFDELKKVLISKTFKGGEIIFNEGDRSNHLFILSTGEVDLVKYSPDGRERLIRSVDEGETFAEAAVFFGEEYPATAVCRTDSTILSIERKKFINFIKTNPEVSLKMMGSMAKLLRHLNRLVAEISMKSVPARLARYLIAESKEAGSNRFELKIKKTELAFKLGTISETLSRTLKKFKDDGLISVSGKLIEILNSSGLSSIKDK